MNAGLSNLADLKAQLLAPSLRLGTQHDGVILAIGLGVAGLFDRLTNRRLAYLADDTFTCSAEREHLFIPRAPVVNVSKLELKTSLSEGWVEQPASVIANSDLETGYLFFVAPPGPHYAQLRVTSTGGYWFSTYDEGDDVALQAQPANSTALPAELRLAFFLQCRRVWETLDKLGAKITKVGSDATNAIEATQALDLVPMAELTLQHYRRYAIT